MRTRINNERERDKERHLINKENCAYLGEEWMPVMKNEIGINYFLS